MSIEKPTEEFLHNPRHLKVHDFLPIFTLLLLRCDGIDHKGGGESAYNFEDFFVVLVGPLLRSRSPEALDVSE